MSDQTIDFNIQASVIPAREPASATTQTHVTADDFSIFYGANEAVKSLSLEIPAGQVTAIIGPSGCGKSTFLRAINRMNDLIPNCHVKGKLIFDGHDIFGPRIDVTALRRRVGMVFQKP
ncbi:MAG TPA: phosphate ABC transporter ATP-binding protein, partial [Planctomycetaceae bacterium]|nr:phosphate ABC transporter ATP-binding protein [Planctomycetaceae bacterium]